MTRLRVEPRDQGRRKNDASRRRRRETTGQVDVNCP